MRLRRKQPRGYLVMLTLTGNDANGGRVITHHRDTYTVEGPVTEDELFRQVYDRAMVGSLIVGDRDRVAVSFWYVASVDRRL